MATSTKDLLTKFSTMSVPTEEYKIAAEKAEQLSECVCIPREIRATCIDQQVVEAVKDMGKSEVVLLSVGSGCLGQEWYITQALAQENISVKWILIDKAYKDEKSKEHQALKKFHTAFPADSLLAVHIDLFGHATFKLGKTAYTKQITTIDSPLCLCDALPFTDIIYPNIGLNCVILGKEKAKKPTDFASYPSVDLILCIDLNPTDSSDPEATDSEATRKLTIQSTIQSIVIAKHLNPNAKTFFAYRKGGDSQSATCVEHMKCGITDSSCVDDVTRDVDSRDNRNKFRPN